jgi:hypothetical protein
VTTFSTPSRPARRAAACGGRARPAATRRATGAPASPSTQGGTTRSGAAEGWRRRGLGRLPALRPRAPGRAVRYRSADGGDSVRVSPAQPLGLGALLRGHGLSPLSPLPGLFRQWATCICEPLVQLRAVLLGLGNRLRRLGDLLPQLPASSLRVLGSLQRIGAVGIRVGHDRPATLPSSVLPPTLPDARVTGATSGPQPTRPPRTTPGNDGHPTSQFRSPCRPASLVVRPPRFSLARRLSLSTQPVCEPHLGSEPVIAG